MSCDNIELKRELEELKNGNQILTDLVQVHHRQISESQDQNIKQSDQNHALQSRNNELMKEVEEVNKMNRNLQETITGLEDKIADL